jgi:hypothetical protein
MGRSLARWRALTGQQKSQLVLLAIALPATGALIRLLGFQKAAKACARMGGQAPLRPSSAQDLEDAQAFARLAAVAGRHGPVTTTCLRQSLVVRAWLRRRGLDAQLKIGVRKNGAVMDAHAWVELDGVPLAQPNLDHAAFNAPDLGA